MTCQKNLILTLFVEKSQCTYLGKPKNFIQGG